METLESFVNGFEEIMTTIVTHGLARFNIFVLVAILTIISLPAYYAFSAITKATWIRTTQSVIEGKNILYVIAHPDDESM